MPWALGLSGLAGCSKVQMGVYEGYAVEYYPRIKCWQGSFIYLYSKEKNGGYISVRDDNNDGEFDEIHLETVNSTDPVKKYANFDTANKILDEMNSGK